MAPDLLSTICREIDERLHDLRPLLAEQRRLLEAADALLDEHRADVEASAQPRERVATSSRTRQLSAATRSRRSSAGAKPKAATAAKPEAQSESDAQSKAKPESASKPKLERASRGAAREAILGALDHGSHTVGELVVVTAMSAPNINGNLRRLEAEGVVVKAEREGKAAWALNATD